MAERRGAAPAGPRQSDDALQKTRQQTRLFSPRKRPKTMQNDLRSSFLAPFRADRATAASDIIHHVADDDLRRSSAAAARKMSVYVWSAFLAGTRFRVKIAPWVARFGRDLPATTACARGVGRGNRRARSGPMPRQATFPAWPFLGPAASFAAGSSARRLVERNGARQRRAAQPSAAPPRGKCSAIPVKALA